MVKLTLIARVADGLPLAEGLDNDKDPDIAQYKSQAKSLLSRSAHNSSSPNMLSIESGKYVFHYLVDQGVKFLTMTEKGYPRKLAFQYLQELSQEFSRLYGTQVISVTRPYAFIKFDTFIQKTKKLYIDTQTQRNMAKLNEDLAEVHTIMTKNIADMLGYGEKLDNMSKLSQNLVSESKMYSAKATDLNRQALLKKYLPVLVVLGVVVVILLLRRIL